MNYASPRTLLEVPCQAAIYPHGRKPGRSLMTQIYSVEKIIVTVFSVIMVLSVFVSVTWTTLASPNSKLAFIFAGSDDADHAWAYRRDYLVAGRLYLGSFHRDGRGCRRRRKLVSEAWWPA